MKLTLFDLDNTLIAGDSDFEWAQFLMTKGAVDRERYEARNRDFLAEYRAGTLDIQAFLDFQLAPLARYPRRDLLVWRNEFVRERILPLITAQARDLVAQEQGEAHVVAIVTATNRFVTEPIAAAFGIHDLIATEPEVGEDGEYTGRVQGIPSFREGKITRVDEWLRDRDQGWGSFTETAFYSDSLNDLPLLSRVSRAVAVDPDDTLAAHARAQGWPIISLR